MFKSRRVLVKMIVVCVVVADAVNALKHAQTLAFVAHQLWKKYSILVVLKKYFIKNTKRSYKYFINKVYSF